MAIAAVMVIAAIGFSNVSCAFFFEYPFVPRRCRRDGLTSFLSATPELLLHRPARFHSPPGRSDPGVDSCWIHGGYQSARELKYTPR